MASVIKSVERRSPAFGKVEAGDTLISINGNTVEDVLDYKYYSYDSDLMLVLKTPDGGYKIIRVRKPEGTELGIEFEHYLMDEARSCRNSCIFCFIDQLPPNVRETLKFKDDDARLSFLLGNYITLTNLSERELDRIIKLKISPVNISVQTTNPDLRVKMLRNKRAGELMGILRRFKDAGIKMNCQIVCCPGINDGEELKHSMRELAELYPEVASVSVVPVGITKYREKLYPLTPCGKNEAEGIISAVDSFGDECLEKLGSRLFYCADELYLKAGRDMPEEAYYEGYPQIENGVGMMRSMEEEFKIALKNVDFCSAKPFSIATGVAAAPYLTKILKLAMEKCDSIKANIYAIENDFFGRTVDVAGLVSGRDMVAQLKGRELGERLLIPASMLRHGGDVFLDDMTRQETQKALGVPIITVANDGFEFADAVFDLK